MFAIVSGAVLYSCGLILLDNSLHLSVETSMFYDLLVFLFGSVLSLVGAYVATVYATISKRRSSEANYHRAAHGLSNYSSRRNGTAIPLYAGKQKGDIRPGLLLLQQ